MKGSDSRNKRGTRGAQVKRYEPCPFAFDAYQWMRNSALAAALRETDGVMTRVLATYANAPYLQTAAKVMKGSLGVKPKEECDEIIPLPYDKILEIVKARILMDHGEISRIGCRRKYAMLRLDNLGVLNYRNKLWNGKLLRLSLTDNVG